MMAVTVSSIPEGMIVYIVLIAAAVLLLPLVLRPLFMRREVPELIDELEGHDFEAYCAELLRKNGFTDVVVTKGSGDFGLDILCEREGVTYGIQCKRYDKPIGVFAVQQTYAGRDYYGRMVGAVMTNQYFTEAAVKAAKKLNIMLWDRGYLDEMER